QAEDGIRDFHVTGVQTCALPMSKLETSLIHEGEQFNTTNSVVAPIYHTSTYVADEDIASFAHAATAPKYPEFYHRHGNPTNSQVAAVIARLEKTEDALVLATGMAAISTAMLAAVQAGDHVIIQNAHYSAALIFMREFLQQYGVEVSHVDQTDNAAFDKAIRPNTISIYI